MSYRGDLRQGTAATIKLGPFMNEDDGKTPETGLTISQADVRLSKAGGDFAQKNESSACTHDELSFYDCDLDATDTDTTGILTVVVLEAGALIVRQEYTVLSASQYDEKYASKNALVIARGTMQSGSTSATAVLAASTSVPDDLPRGSVLAIVAGTGAVQARFVVGWASSTDTASVSPDWDTTPDDTSVYAWLYGPPSTTSSLPQVETVVLAGQAITAMAGANFNTFHDNGDSVSTVVQDDVVAGATSYKKGVAVTAFGFFMRATDGSAAEGATVTAEISKDGGAFNALAGSVTEISDGAYEVDIADTEMTADEVLLSFTATGCLPTMIKIRTET